MSILLVSVNSKICHSEEIVLLEKGSIAPFRGLLFSPEKSQKMYDEFQTLKEKMDKLQRLNALYEENEFLYERKVNVMLEQNIKLTDALTKTENSKQLDRLMWFGLGFLSVGLGIYAAKTATNQ